MSSNKHWREATRLVHGGTRRSAFGETSEALFLTQGFIYESAEAAERRFKGEDAGYVYSRYANPTNAMFEERMCLLEGAEAARSTASGMAAVSASIGCQVKRGRPRRFQSRALFGSCRYIVENTAAGLRRRMTTRDRWSATSRQWRGSGARLNTKLFSFWKRPPIPILRTDRHSKRSRRSGA